MNEQPLKDRVAVVTGASRGIGQAIAQRLASGGATVVVSARSVERSVTGLTGTLYETVGAIEAFGGKAIPISCDVENADSRAQLIEETVKQAGRIDILINNAGRAVYKKIDEFTAAEELSQVQQYFLGPYDLTRLAVVKMMAQGGGAIVFLGSNTAFTPEGPPWNDFTANRGAALYSGLKAAIHRLTISLAAELQPHNISVNAVGPVRATMTPGLRSMGIMREENNETIEPIEHIAEAALALVSGTAQTVTGHIALSYKYLDKIGRSTRSLDGKKIVLERKAQ